MPRYVVLEHCLPDGHERGLHWDLMLEAPPVLRTWALAAAPAGHAQIAAEQLSPHRLAYLDYEGPISGNRGSVKRWGHGTFCWLLDDSDRVEILLSGGRLSGKAVLVRDPTSDAGEPQRWLFTWLAA